MPDWPSIADVARIAAMDDPVLRNLRITQCYHELSQAFAPRTGRRANWCTFATWASKQAGQTIRGEDLARALAAALQSALAAVQVADAGTATARGLGPPVDLAALRAAVRDALSPAAMAERAGAAVAVGNLKVFAEIGDAFARFLALYTGGATPDAADIAHFSATLRPGEPPDGQRLLRQAFGHYQQAFVEQDPTASLELLLLANLEIGLHEQTRLQPDIAAALEAAFIEPAELRRRVLAALAPRYGWLVRLRWAVAARFGGRTPLDRAIDDLVTAARQGARLVLTEHMMVIGLPCGERLRLGDDLRARFPEALRQIAHPELRALLARVDPTPDSTVDTGAVDWADLAERLHFIADMFRCLADTPALFEPPFSPAQVAAIAAGEVPGGVL
jgi:hypothetical protein